MKSSPVNRASLCAQEETSSVNMACIRTHYFLARLQTRRHNPYLRITTLQRLMSVNSSEMFFSTTRTSLSMYTLKDFTEIVSKRFFFQIITCSTVENWRKPKMTIYIHLYKSVPFLGLNIFNRFCCSDGCISL